MARIELSNNGDTSFQKILGHKPDILKAWKNLEEVIQTSGAIDEPLKEEARRVLAHENGCQYCMAKGKPKLTYQDQKMATIVAFAEIAMKEPKGITEQQLDLIKEYFSDAELVEWITYICFTSAAHHIGAILGLSEND